VSGETIVTIVGNLTADPVLRFIQSGAGVANFTVASTPQRYNSQTKEYEDGDALFMRCSIWKGPAENVVESLTKGQRVIVTGRMKTKSWEDPEGNKRSNIELEVDEMGPSLKFGTASFSKTGRDKPKFEPSTRSEDPWGSDEPPF
jgi:single-strand DNA-binding protein